MTQDELDALPEWPTGFSLEERMIDGVLKRVPVAPPMAVLATGDDEPMMILDRKGRTWSTGWHDGKQWKRRRSEYDF
jgi:hypothetical protein